MLPQTDCEAWYSLYLQSFDFVISNECRRVVEKSALDPNGFEP
jgi:hypothetical protein